MHKFKNLDGLRGLAALAVVLCHYANGFLPSIQGWSSATRHTSYDKLIATTPLHLPLAGNFAVYIFFVLSGFVLSHKFFRTKSLDVVISSATRRYTRLMIPALGSILITYAFLRFGLLFNHQTAQITGSTIWLDTFWAFPAHIGTALYEGLYGSFFRGQVTYNSSLWTMQLELFGSFLIFMFMALFGKLNKRWVLYVVFGIIFIKSDYLAFLLGMILSDVWVNVPSFKKFVGQRLSLLLLVSGLFLGAWYTSAWSDIYNHITLPLLNPAQLSVLAHIVGATFVIIAILQLGWLTKFFEHRILQFLGKISFSLYLIHLVLLGSIASFIFNHLVWRIGYGEAFIVSSSATLTITLIAAHFYTKYIDNGAIVFSRVIGDYLLSNNRQSSMNKEEGLDLSPRKTLPTTELATSSID